jgi:prolyl oligopeptidase
VKVQKVTIALIKYPILLRFTQTLTSIMQTLKLFLPILLFVMSCSTATNEETAEVPMPPYPETPVNIVTDTIWGVQLDDPYRYLEEIKDPSVTEWFKAHGERARTVLDAIHGRQGLIDQMKEFDARQSSSIYSVEITDNDRYFYLKETPDDETGKVFYRDGFSGSETLLFDPDDYGDDPELTFTISAIYPSNDGLKLGIEVSPNGSESSTLLIMDVESQEMLPEQIDRLWYASCSWFPDNSAFLYNRLSSDDVLDPNRNKNSKVFIHRLGTEPSEDVEFFSRAKNPDLDIKEEEYPIAGLDENSDYLIGFSLSVDNRRKVWYAPKSELASDKIKWLKLFSPEDEVYNFTTDANYIYAYTPKDAKNFKILRLPWSNPDLDNAEVLVPEMESEIIEDFSISDEALYFSTMKNGVQAKLYKTDYATGKTEEIELPKKAGSISISSKGPRFSDVWVNISGWTQSNTRYRYNSESNEFTVETMSSKAEFPEYEDLIVEELMVPSHDGTMVPLSLIYKKGLKKDGSNPVMLLGYGSYGISISPFFSPSQLIWTLKGGIFAVAHVRGGGELGNEWHLGGQKTTKPNTWKDLIACTVYLINENYTNPKKVAINSGSAGGILVGRAMIDRPDLFAAVIPEVGSMNTVRGEETPNGPVNAPEFGTVKDSVEFMALLEMDSYQKLSDGVEYPATLITAGMNDPRVIAWQPGKFAARMSAANGSDEPILFLADFEAGHGMGDSKSKMFASLADVMGFAFWQLNHPEFRITELTLKTEHSEVEEGSKE